MTSQQLRTALREQADRCEVLRVKAGQAMRRNGDNGVEVQKAWAAYSRAKLDLHDLIDRAHVATEPDPVRAA